jgi:DNA-binding NarL/FixJ family response regulator
MPVRIFVADDHDIVREGVKSLLSSRADWVVCGEAANGNDAVAGVCATAPDVAVLDISMPGLSGLDAAKKISKANSDVKILFFTMHDSKSLVRAVRDAGARGLVLKSCAARDLLRAIDLLLAGESFFESQDPRESKSGAVSFLLLLSLASA